jgi:hypothetical protein
MTGLTLLPTKKQSRETLNVGPLNARVMLAGMPKSGKTTLLSNWAPNSTLIIDTQRGTDLLPGEHYVAHVTDWTGFCGVVDKLAAGGHAYKTVCVDLTDDIWNFVDRHYAGPGKSLATATDDYGKSAKQAEGEFRAVIGKLLATDLGVWFTTHAKPVEEGQLTRYVATLSPKVLTFVNGAVQFLFLAETLGLKRVLHTGPSAKFDAGSRVPLPEPMEMDARKLYQAMAAGLKSPEKKQSESTEGETA